jgi:transposase
MNAIWYVLWTGCQWKALHRSWFAVSASAVHARFQNWRRLGVFEQIMCCLARYYGKKRPKGFPTVTTSNGNGNLWTAKACTVG